MQVLSKLKLRLPRFLPGTSAPNSIPSPVSSPHHPVDEMIRCYGDLVFDLCESVLWSPQNAQLAFRLIVKELRSRIKGNDFNAFERAWVLKLAYEKLLFFAQKYGRRPTASEQIELDASPTVSSRIKRFEVYFHRLTIQDQIILLLRDKYGIPYPEISAAMGIPEGSLKISRQQALRTLEEWLWDAQ